MLNRPRLWNLE